MSASPGAPGNGAPDAYACAVPAAAVPIHRLSSTLLHGGRVLKSLLALATRGRETRSPECSLEEYEDRWRRLLERAPWRETTEVAEYLKHLKGRGHRITAMMEGREYDVAVEDFYPWRAAKIAKIFSTHHDLDQPIVELGCGYGKNLLALWAGGFRRLRGFEVCHHGMRALEDLNRHFKTGIGVARFDLTDGASEHWRSLEGEVVFTNYVMEQLPQHLEAVVDRLAAAGPAEVLHIEPVEELLHAGRSAIDLETWLHIYRRDYQRRLLSVLDERRRAGRLRILEVTPLGFSPSVRSSPALIRWRPRSGEELS